MSPRERRATAADLQSRLVSTDLKALLDRAKGSRPVLKHLAMLEIRLRLEGPAMIDTLSLETLRKVVDQLETVLPYPVPQSVAALRARLDTALVAREREHQAKVAPPPTMPAGLAPLTLLGESKPVVEEASLTDFDREVRSWAPTEPVPPGGAERTAPNVSLHRPASKHGAPRRSRPASAAAASAGSGAEPPAYCSGTPVLLWSSSRVTPGAISTTFSP
jgi:hypothetical protein